MNICRRCRKKVASVPPYCRDCRAAIADMRRPPCVLCKAQAINHNCPTRGRLEGVEAKG